jgi:hypothetical protein
VDHVYTTTTGTGGTQTLTVSRFRPLRPHERHAGRTQYGYSLWEFTIRTGSPRRPRRLEARRVAEPRARTQRAPSPARPDPGNDVLLSYNKPAFASSSPERRELLTTAPRPERSTSTRLALGDQLHDRLGRPRLDLRRPRRHRSDPPVVLQWDPAFAVAYQLRLA